MLVELKVRDLGVIESATVDLGPGMTALTGETGAGKTLVVEALELLLGGRADPVLVRPGAAEALVEGRFVVDDEEVILARAVPAQGRSRAWVDGRMAPVAALAEAGARLADLHGQHVQQSLLSGAAQRRALDDFGHIDLGPLDAARRHRRGLEEELTALGGDDRARVREADLLRYQLADIDGAALDDPDEDDRLAEEEDRLAESSAHRAAAAEALAALRAEDAEDAEGRGAAGAGAVDRLGAARAALHGRAPLASWAERLDALQADVADVASELRAVVETWEDDPERLGAVRARRQLLRDLARKYGEGVAGVLIYAEEARGRLQAIESAAVRATQVAAELDRAQQAVADEEAAVGSTRRQAAPALAAAAEARLRELAMPRARLLVTVGEAGPGDEVTFLLGANPGEAVLPLAKVASGGELARAMLALRLVLSDAPPTMVFDEVDAGVGGEAALAVGRALAELATDRQVLVVTHLAQVAAFARRQLAVRKDVVGKRTVAEVEALDGEVRVVELARMLSGRPDSATARRHAQELLAGAS